MRNSAALPRTSLESASTFKPLPENDWTAEPAEPSPVRHAWTEELEHRRRAVARWRGSDHALKETMLRE